MKLPAFLIIFGLVVMAGAVLAGCKKQTINSSSLSVSPTGSPTGKNMAKMELNGKVYDIELARTSAEQTKGLGERDTIGSDGMLFIFEREGTPAFWMKGMRFDLDFIWMNNDTITQVMTNIKKPDSDNAPLSIYRPRDSVDMMLEVPAGWAESENVKVGDKVKFSQ
jgi:uncharacterized membrane protein (UPF0127 family)